MDKKTNASYRPIGKDEDEQLDCLWEQLPHGQKDAYSGGRGFADLQARIRKEHRRRIGLRVGVATGIAAALLAGVFFLHRPVGEVSSLPPVAQLQDMGVTVSGEQVVLKMGDAVVMSLDSVAHIKRQQEGRNVALQSSTGEQLAVEAERTLKLEVPAGRHFRMTLEDGTQVWLNASSSLEYPASFGGKKERRVRLRGEAFFEVAHNEQCPFYVETDGQESIRVLGTSFNVSAYPDSRTHTATLVTGRISYRSGVGEEPILLAPDQQVILDCAEGEATVAHVDASAYTAWKDGWIYFEDESLPDLAQRLARMYGADIRVADRLKHLRFSGKISYERGVDYITRLMAETNGIACVVEDGVLWLK